MRDYLWVVAIVLTAVVFGLHSAEGVRREATVPHRIRWLLLAAGFFLVAIWSFDTGVIPDFGRRGSSRELLTSFGNFPTLYWLVEIWLFGIAVYCVSRAFGKRDDP